MGYWEDRAVVNENREFLKYKQVVEEKLRPAFQLMLDDVQEKIQSYYDKTGGDYNKLRQQMGIVERTKFQRTLNRLINDLIKIDDKQYSRELKGMADRINISRLQALEIEIKHQLEKLYFGTEDGVKSLIDTLGNDIISSSYSHTTYDLLKDRGYGFDNISINQDTIKDIVTFPWSGELYSDKIWKDKELLLSNIKQTMLKSFIQGTSFSKLSVELSDKVGVSYVNAERLVRTESNYFMGQASKKAYLDQNITSYEYLAIIDAVTSKVCNNLDGQIFPVSEATPGVNYPPMHPNCRSTTLPVVGDYDKYDFDFNKLTTYKEFTEKYE